MLYRKNTELIWMVSLLGSRCTLFFASGLSSNTGIQIKTVPKFLFSAKLQRAKSGGNIKWRERKRDEMETGGMRMHRMAPISGGEGCLRSRGRLSCRSGRSDPVKVLRIICSTPATLPASVAAALSYLRKPEESTSHLWIIRRENSTEVGFLSVCGKVWQDGD